MKMKKVISNKRLFLTGLAFLFLGKVIYYLVGGMVGAIITVAFDVVSLPMLAIAIMRYFIKLFSRNKDDDQRQDEKVKELRKDEIEISRKKQKNNRNNYKILFFSTIGTIILIFSVLFYWMAIRPVNIRKSCALIEIKTYSQEEKDNAKNYLQKNCPNFESLADRVILRNEGSQECLNKLDILYAPTGNENQIRSATDKKYKECLRMNGLETE